jgi:hypothetical protein
VTRNSLPPVVTNLKMSFSTFRASSLYSNSRRKTVEGKNTILLVVSENKGGGGAAFQIRLCDSNAHLC